MFSVLLNKGGPLEISCTLRHFRVKWKHYIIGHFQVPPGLCIKTRLSVNETLFHKKGCALGLMLEVRVFGTWKWPNVAGQYNMMGSFSYWACISVSLFWALNIEKLAPFLEINNENRSMKLKIIL